MILSGFSAFSQCHYIPSTSTTNDTVIYNFTGGGFASYGCLPIDPTFWLAGYGISVTVTFVEPQDYPVFRVWGMNDDDSASVSVGGNYYPMTYSSAIYDPKVICGISPGPDGIIFANGKIVGANSNMIGNYSYQDVQLFLTDVTTFTVTGISGAGWGFAGVLVDCPLFIGVDEHIPKTQTISISPNPLNSSALIRFSQPLSDATLLVCNPQGQIVKTIRNISGSQVKFDRGNLPSGIYLIRLLEKDTLIEIKKLIIAG